ncbi:MAG TPA: porin [Kofleriaceae bacterium]
MGAAVQSGARYGHDSIPSPDTMDLMVRRARVALDETLPNGAGFHLELQARDLKVGLADAYGRWAFDEHIELHVGYLHTPGGLERDTSPFDLPFVERSTLASMTRDRELGVAMIGHQSSEFWTVSITRDAPVGVGGDDPEFSIAYPKGVMPEAAERSATTWNQAARVGTAPSDQFAAAFDWTLRIRNSQPDYGDPAYEPMGSVYLEARPYRGVGVRVGADAAVAQPHVRVLMEAAFRRDGQQLYYDPNSGIESRLPGHEWWAGGYLVVGVSPSGRYGRAIDGAPLRAGWEIVGRFEAMQVKPVDAFSATIYAETLGWTWIATSQIRVQVDATLEKLGPFDQTRLLDNANATRVYAEAWATWKL